MSDQIKLRLQAKISPTKSSRRRSISPANKCGEKIEMAFPLLDGARVQIEDIGLTITYYSRNGEKKPDLILIT